jgi:hypothetical protein
MKKKNEQVEYVWNGSDRGNPKYWQENLSQYHFIHHKSYIDYSQVDVCEICCGQSGAGTGFSQST